MARLSHKSRADYESAADRDRVEQEYLSDGEKRVGLFSLLALPVFLLLLGWGVFNLFNDSTVNKQNAYVYPSTTQEGNTTAASGMQYGVGGGPSIGNVNKMNKTGQNTNGTEYGVGGSPETTVSPTMSPTPTTTTSNPQMPGSPNTGMGGMAR